MVVCFPTTGLQPDNRRAAYGRRLTLYRRLLPDGAQPPSRVDGELFLRLECIRHPQAVDDDTGTCRGVIKQAYLPRCKLRG